MSEDAVRVWERLWDLVAVRHDRRKRVVDELGLSFVKTKALRRLAARPMTLRELAEELLIDRPYATVLVDDLEQRGLVERTVRPEDRRSKIVTPTAAGRAAAETANRILSEPPESLLALPPEDLAALDRILDRLT
ncbi:MULTISPECIES: MarR family winged helix-turn-helix transcriptional regulator [Amycolatopsis]|uniref:DNA-binding transcriptional regulator, MarR family n=2 Tax=Amycolatopsis TaxID=1813 RepID=A0A1I3UGU6_9PSEU|nr:MarR family transcriptional regulator [Amycolatopsis sacchari]SFJ82132.1 DNA-binding transcriptional regulator, MarR family [Amycolatopsis sacchari]